MDLPSLPAARADLLLAAIALPMVLAGVIAAAISVPLAYALGVGAIPAGGGLSYALFVSPAPRQ